MSTELVRTEPARKANMTAQEAKSLADQHQRQSAELWEELKRVEESVAPYLRQLEVAKSNWHTAYQRAELFGRMAEEIERNAKEI